jgi:hypothetical protein
MKFRFGSNKERERLEERMEGKQGKKEKKNVEEGRIRSSTREGKENNKKW